MKIVLTLAALSLSGLLGPQTAAPELSQQDKVLVAVQEICPVSGEKLGEHGTPIKAKIGEEEMFLCCKACLKGQVNPQHWATIHENFAKAQGICPVMKNKLPEKPVWTIAKGHVFYVCCKPCTEKIVADPDTYLEELMTLYRKTLKSRGVIVK